MFDLFGDQHLALTVEAAAIFLLRVWAPTIAHTRGSPLTPVVPDPSASPSILSVFAPAGADDVAIEADRRYGCQSLRSG